MLTSLIAVGILGLQAGPPQRQMACVFERTEPTPMKMKYWLYLPKEYTSKANEAFPLMLFLHGSGDSGDDLDQVKKLHGPPMLIDKGKDFPFIVVSPLDGIKTFLWGADVLHALLDDVEAKYRVDKNRVGTGPMLSPSSVRTDLLPLRQLPDGSNRKTHPK